MVHHVVDIVAANLGESLLRCKREEVWNTMDEEAKKIYGREYLDEIYNSLLGLSKTYPDDLTPVVRAMRSGLLSKRPRERYPCGAGMDAFVYFNNLLPVWLQDKILGALEQMPKSVKPAGLRETT